MPTNAEATFGEMLTEAIQVIKKCQHQNINIVQDELGYALEPIRTGSAVERWRYGALPPSFLDVEALARAIIQRSCSHFDRKWLYDFLVHGGHPYPEKLCQELFSLANDAITSGATVNRIHNQAKRARSQLILLTRVKKFWIEGVLEQSLHHYILLDITLEKASHMVERPWDVIIQMPNQRERFLTSETSLLDIFDEMNRAMLILGEPGAGKTTMLLSLARDALQRAEQDATQMIPTVFNLASWSGSITEFADWLVCELNSKYHIPTMLGRSWLKANKLLLLLDGLDEVKSTQRFTCIEAINYFRLDYGLTDIAICSRLSEYEALSLRLRLEGAILLQPLDMRQINRYLASAGSKLLHLRTAIGQDTILQELAQSPLMLNIMSLAYQERSDKSFATSLSDSLEMSRDHLFAKYVEYALRRRTKKQYYSSEQTVQWLSWLAHNMAQQSQTVFLLEQLEPTWLSNANQYKLYCFLSKSISTVFGICMGGILGGLVGGLVSSEIGAGFNFDQEWGIVVGFIGWCISDYFSRHNHIHIVEQLTWSWKSVTKNYKIVVSISLLATIIVAFFFILPFGWTIGLIVSGLGGTIILLIIALISGLTAIDIETKTFPNQGVWQSGKSALNVGIAINFIMFLIFIAFGGILGLIVAINQGNLAPLPWALKGIKHLSGEAIIFGLVTGVSGGLLYGGLAFIQHYLLRLTFYLNNNTPLYYVNFLEHATERILLRRVGGGYIFIHRLLLEYFADLKNDHPPKSTRPTPLKKTNRLNWFTYVHSNLDYSFLKFLPLIALAVSTIVYGPTIFSRVSAVSYNFQGNEYRASNKPDEALANYTRAIELNPNYASAYYNRGRIYHNAGNYEAAINNYDIAIRLDLDDEMVYFSRGRAYLLDENYANAIEDFDKVIRINPALANAYYNRGRAYQLKGKLDRAELDFYKAIEIDPHYARAYFNLAGIHADHDNLKAAIENFQKAIELGLEDAASYHSLGVAYERFGDDEKALEQYNKAIVLNPTFARAYYNRANLYVKLNNWGTALTDFNKAIALGLESDVVYYGRGRLYQLMGDADDAILDYNKAIIINPDNQTAYYNRAGIYRKQGDFERAIQDYSKAIELGIQNATIYYDRGLAFSESGQLEEAIVDYSKAIELDPELSKAYYNRGYAYANSGNNFKAIKDFERYLRFNIPESNEGEIRDLIEILRQ